MLVPRGNPGFGEFGVLGDLNSPCSAGVGAVPFPTLRILSFTTFLSGLFPVDVGLLFGRSCAGRGLMGTLSRKNSSGTSSPSSSSHSASNCLTVFLSLFACQLLLLCFDAAALMACRAVIGALGLVLRFRFNTGEFPVLVLRLLRGGMELPRGIKPSPMGAFCC